MKRHNGEDFDPDMPEVSAEYLLGYLFEVGPIHDSCPITHEEIRAWQANIGVKLQPWEARMLRRLSCEYLAESQKSTKQGAPAPWKAPGLKPEKTAAQLALRKLANL